MSAPPAPLRILVTGAAGQLGQSLLERAAHHPSLTLYFTDRQTLDICRPEAIEGWLDHHPVEFIINAAAYTAVDRAEDEPKAALAVNAQAAGQLAELSARRGIRLMHLSSDYVFDGRQSTPYTETDIPRPLNVYGRSKLAGEQLIRHVAPDALILRTSWAFSPYGSNFLMSMLALGHRHDPIHVVDDQFGGPSYAPHIAQVLLTLAQRSRGDIPGGVYHFSGCPYVSWHAFAQEIFAEAVAQGLLASAPNVLPVPGERWKARAQRPHNSCLDSGRLRALIGPLDCDWREGVRDALMRLTYESPAPRTIAVMTSQTDKGDPSWHA